MDRDAFSAEVTETLKRHPLVTVVEGEVDGLPPEDWESVIIATGPLTSPALAEAVGALTCTQPAGTDVTVSDVGLVAMWVIITLPAATPLGLLTVIEVPLVALTLTAVALTIAAIASGSSVVSQRKCVTTSSSSSLSQYW